MKSKMWIVGGGLAFIAALSLRAGNPNPPAGPIGPTMLTLDQIAALVLSQQRCCETPIAWDFRSVDVDTLPGPGNPANLLLLQPATVHEVIISSADTSLREWTFYDATTATDFSRPIAKFWVTGNTNRIPLDIRVTHGLAVRSSNIDATLSVLYQPATP
jgi:hypothetical protein